MSLAAPHRSTGELITASIWNTDLVDPLNSLPVSIDGTTWEGRIVANPQTTAPMNQSFSVFAFQPVVFKNPLGGTHPSLVGVLIDAPLLGAAPTSATSAVTLMVRDAPIGAAQSFSLLVTGNGTSSFQGPLLMATDTNMGISFTDTRLTGLVATSVEAYIGPRGPNFVLLVTTDTPLLLGVNNIQTLRLLKDNLTLDFYTADLEYLTLQSTGDVFHDFATDTARQAFGTFRKEVPTEGGLAVAGFTRTTTGLTLNGNYTTGDITKATTATAAVVITARRLFNGTGNQMATDENLLVLRNYVNAKFIVNSEGDSFYDGAAAVNYDAYDDIALTRSLDLTFRGPDLIDSAFDQFVQYNRDDLERAGIVTPGGFINATKHSRLLNGSVWQLFLKLQALTERIAQLEATA